MATAQTIIDAARRLIADETSAAISGYRWSDAELLAWITEAQRAVVMIKPEANPVTATHTVTTTSARQRLNPATAYRLIRVERNA